MTFCDILLVHVLFTIVHMQYIAKSKRYIPEVVNYLTSCSGCFCDGKGTHTTYRSEPATYTSMLMYMYVYYVGKVFPPFSPKSCPVLEFEGELGEGTDMDSPPS